MCHVGGFGPQLTPYGRNFKLHGYTQRATAFSVPITVMAMASYVRTASDQDGPPADHFGANDNVALDQASIFFAGGFGDHLGAFAQATYDGVSRSFSWDNVDLRLTTAGKIANADVLLGLSVNNSPGVQDPWNTLPAWGFPYTDSALAPPPAAAPLLSGALAQTSLGATAYAWINSAVYVEAGAYGSPSAGFLSGLGADPASPGDIDGLASYGRLAFQTMVRGGTLEVGAVGLKASIHPGRDRSTSLIDHYTDLGIDGSYQKVLAKGDVGTVDARYLHERQALAATCALALDGTADPGGVLAAGCGHSDLNDLRLDASYYWRDKIGLTLGAFDTFGSANPTLYPDNRTFKPDSTGVTVQLDGTPFGGASQPLRRLNMRLGLQYTIYTRFDGARRDFDGAGRNASANNTLRFFTWFAF